MIKHIKYIILLSILIISNSYAHNTVKGTIKDSLGNPVIGATIRLENTTLGAIANKNGEFILKRIPPGIYKMRVSAVGYEPFLREIDFSHKEDITEEILVILSESSILSQDVVISATRTEKIYEDIPIKVSTIDNRVFESTLTASIQEGIRFSPGLRIEANCQNCGFSQVRLNGLEGRYSQILIDGKPIFSALNSLYGLDQIPANMIDRVEVIRGGGSALYGGNAIAGIVNIITKAPIDNSFEYNSSYGLIGNKALDYSHQINGSALTENHQIGFYVFGNFNKRDAFDSNSDGFSEIPTINNTSFGARAFYSPTIKSKFIFDFQSINEYRRGGDSLHLPPHEVMMAEDLTHKINAGSISYEQFLDNINSKLSLYASINNTNKRNYTGTNKDPNGYGLTDSKIFVSGSQFSYNLNNGYWGSAIFTSGIEYLYERIFNEATGYRSTFDQNVHQFGFYCQMDWIINDHINILSGVRIDKHNFIKNLIFNPRISILFKNPNDLSIRTSFTTGYRAPQAYDEDLHAEFRAGQRMLIQLSENLKEERSYSLNFGLDKYFSIYEYPFSLSGEIFYSKLIDVFVNEDSGQDDLGNIIYIKTNGDGASVYGANFELRTSYSYYYQLQFGITLQKALYDSPVIWYLDESENGSKNLTTSEILRTPNSYGYLTAFINPIEHLEFVISMIYTGSMQVPHFAGGIGIDGNINKENLLKTTSNFLEINSSISYIFSDVPEIKLTFAINNLFNNYQKDFDRGPNRDSNYIYGPLKPRTYRIGINVRL